MSEAYIIRRGGGASLNYKVVGSTTEPTKKENTIWVNTSTAITSHAFSATEPHRVSKNKNLMVHPFRDTTKTENGITWTDNGNGTVSANGTATAKSTFVAAFVGVSEKEMLLEAGTYTLSGSPSGSSSTTYDIAICYSYDDWVSSAWKADQGAAVTFTLTKSAKVRCNLTVNSGVSVSDITFKPQLEKGTTATSFVKGDATGQVWFLVGTTAAAPFNMLKKNTAMIYPFSCKQYEGGAWASKTAKTYQGSKWVEWRTYLFNSGTDNTDLTGGYEGTGTYGKVSIADGVIFTYSSSADKTASSKTKNAVDLTNFNTIYFMVEACTGSSGKVALSDSGSTSSSELDFYTSVETSNTPTLYSIDISTVTGSYYIVMTSYATTTKGIKVSAIYLE